MITINLPNPNEMSIPSFFAQMRIALKAAEKSYEEIEKATDPEQEDRPYILFGLPVVLENELEDKGIDDTEENFQRPTIEIYEP